MLMIRLQRIGRRNHAEFRVVVTEHSRAAKSSNYVEVLGNYSPHTDTATINAERVTHWIANGAQVSPTVHNLLVTHKILDGKKKNVLPKKTPILKEVPAAETTPSASKPATAEEPVAA